MLHHAGCPGDITLYLISLKMNLNIRSNINIKWYPLTTVIYESSGWLSSLSVYSVRVYMREDNNSMHSLLVLTLRCRIYSIQFSWSNVFHYLYASLSNFCNLIFFQSLRRECYAFVFFPSMHYITRINTEKRHLNIKMSYQYRITMLKTRRSQGNP